MIDLSGFLSVEKPGNGLKHSTKHHSYRCYSDGSKSLIFMGIMLVTGVLPSYPHGIKHVFHVESKGFLWDLEGKATTE